MEILEINFIYTIHTSICRLITNKRVFLLTKHHEYLSIFHNIDEFSVSLQLLIVMFFILFIKLQKSYLLCPQTISPFKADSRMYSANLRLAFLALSLKAS